MIRIRLTLPRSTFRVELDLALPGQGISVLFGASGAGKTSVLRCVAGLERAQNGLIQVSGETWQDDAQRIFLPPWKRRLGYVFQEPSLFEHLDVRRNLEYGLRRAGVHRATLDHAVDLLDIGELMTRRVQKLSGGERQRVAIARALATEPKLLLLDEPLASIDLARRQEILPWLERLRDDVKTPILYVTHSAEEVTRLADHLVVLDRGQVLGSGPVAEVLAQVETPLTVGEDAGALIQGMVTERDGWHLAKVQFDGGSLWVRGDGLSVSRPVRLRVLARDASITLNEPTDTSILNHLPCTIESITPDTHPSQALVRVNCGSTVLFARVTHRSVATLGLKPGMPAWVQVKSVAVLV